ncbi:MAG: roadblock/LC7 domain-containing protein [Polyangiaceae bacterium]|jgi:predicted regulator of Ras-like GTPase activity (Roadblock/LC7/MglB family)|nr:roadblock/LC7 domain-containing protein [Polyangiaceae bacterium]
MPSPQQLDTFLEQIHKGNPDVGALLLIDSTGRVIANRTASTELTRVAVAMAVPLRELLERTTAELGCGELRTTLIEGENASLALADVDGDRSVVVVGVARASLGALRADSLWLVDQLRSTQPEGSWT